MALTMTRRVKSAGVSQGVAGDDDGGDDQPPLQDRVIEKKLVVFFDGGTVILIKPSDHFFFSPFPSFFTKDSQGPMIFLKHQTTPFFKEVSASRTP